MVCKSLTFSLKTIKDLAFDLFHSTAVYGKKGNLSYRYDFPKEEVRKQISILSSANFIKDP